MANAGEAMNNEENEFLRSWFPNLDSGQFIIPVTHLDYIAGQPQDIGGQQVAVLVGNNESRGQPLSLVNPIRDLDESFKILHFCLSRIKEEIALGDAMVMMTQVSLESLIRETPALNTDEYLTRISKTKMKYSDLMVVNRQRGLLVGIVNSVHFNDPVLMQENLNSSLSNVTIAAHHVTEIVRRVPGADNVAVHKTLVLPNITRAQLEKTVTTAWQGVPCLCKDEMVTAEGLQRWWQACWLPGQRDVMDRYVYRSLVAKFAIPAARVEIYLTTQPRLQLKHEHDVVDAVGDIHGAEVFQAGLYQLSLFQTQARLLDYDGLDKTENDVKCLVGPPGTGKTVLLVLRALQWVKHFGARQIFILQTTKDGIAASCLVEYQLRQTLNAQQQRAQCTFTHVDISHLCPEVENAATGRYEMELGEEGKEMLQTTFPHPDAVIYIVADEANGDVVAAVYQWLTEKGVKTVRLWAATIKKNIPASLQHAVCPVTEPLRCPGPVVEEVQEAFQIQDGEVLPYNGRPLTSEPKVEVLPHYTEGLEHTGGPYTWRCEQCANNIVEKLRSLHVGEVRDGRHGLSANDVFILGSLINCDLSEDETQSPALLIRVLRDSGYNVRTLSATSARDEVMAVARREVTPPAVIVANEEYVLGLERKIVFFCDSSDYAANHQGRLVGFSRTTSFLFHIKTIWPDPDYHARYPSRNARLNLN